MAIALVGGLLLLPKLAMASPPLSLAQAAQLARERNPSVAVAMAQVDAARAARKKADSAWWPRLGVEVSYTLTNNSAYAFSYILNQEAFSPSLDFNDVDTVDDLNVTAGVEVPLFAGLSRPAMQQVTEKRFHAARAIRSAVERNLSTETARAWYGAHEARAFVDAARAAVAAFEGNVKVAQRRAEGGTLLRQSVLELELRLAKAKENLAHAKNGHALALSGLRTLLHLEPGAPLILAPPHEVPIPSPDQVAMEPPELTAAGYATEAAEANIGIARAGYFPQVGLRAAAILDHGFIENGNKFSYIAGVAVSWRLWDGWLTSAEVDEALAAAALQRARSAVLRRKLLLAVEQARLRVADARVRVEVTERAIAIAEESVTLARVRFEEGVALPTQLVDAETELTAARVRNADALADLRVHAVELRTVLGLEPIPLESMP